MQPVTFTIVTLNVLYDSRIALDDPHNFAYRWPIIAETINTADVIALQEVHVGFITIIAEFAVRNGYTMNSCIVHAIRQVHLVTLVRTPMYVGCAVHSAPNTYSKALAVTVRGGENDTSGPSAYDTYSTIFNVHLPLDIQVAGERLVATRAFITAASQVKHSIIIGDWNTLSGRGDDAQLEAVTTAGMKIVDWKFVKDAPHATYWGYHFESPQLRGFNTPTILDRMAVGRDITVISATCKHIFIKVNDIEMAISDHFPCRARVQLLPYSTTSNHE